MGLEWRVRYVKTCEHPSHTVSPVSLKSVIRTYEDRAHHGVRRPPNFFYDLVLDQCVYKSPKHKVAVPGHPRLTSLRRPVVKSKAPMSVCFNLCDPRASAALGRDCECQTPWKTVIPGRHSWMDEDHLVASEAIKTFLRSGSLVAGLDEPLQSHSWTSRRFVPAQFSSEVPGRVHLDSAGGNGRAADAANCRPGGLSDADCSILPCCSPSTDKASMAEQKDQPYETATLNPLSVSERQRSSMIKNLEQESDLSSYAERFPSIAKPELVAVEKAPQGCVRSKTILIAGSPYNFEIPPIEGDEYSENLSPPAPATFRRHVVEAGNYKSNRGTASEAKPIVCTARKSHFEEAYVTEQTKLAAASSSRLAYRRERLISSPEGWRGMSTQPEDQPSASETPNVTMSSPHRVHLESPRNAKPAESASTHKQTDNFSPSTVDNSPIGSKVTAKSPQSGTTTKQSPQQIPETNEVIGVEERSAGVHAGAFTASSPPLSKVDASKLKTTSPRLQSRICVGSRSPLLRDEPLTKLRALRQEFIQYAEHKDCTKPNSILEQFQSLALAAFDRMDLGVHFLLAKRLKARPILQGLPALMHIQELNRLKLPALDDLLAETGVSWWAQTQQPFIQPSACGKPVSGYAGENATECMAIINRFISQIKTGDTGGRSYVGSSVRSVNNMPVVLYSCDKTYHDRERRLRNDSDDWGVIAQCILPMYVKCICIKNDQHSDARPGVAGISKNSVSSSTVASKLNSKKAQDVSSATMAELIGLVDEMLNDFRSHLVRCNFETSRRYQAFLPVIDGAPRALLVTEGWQEMRVLSDTCLIRWKTLSGGLILSYMDGIAECAVNKIMCLAYDASNHFQWIPFLSKTERLFATQPYGISFGYQVNLPWPMSNRELTVHGMCTDALAMPINAVQMWCVNNPISATSLLGVPLPPLSPKAVDMEIPTLAFALTPLDGKSDQTRVRLCAVFDLKVAFLPISVQNHLAKLLVTKMFSNVQKIGKEFDKTDYLRIYKANQSLIDNLVSGRNDET